jgi:hypothetical protein
VLLENENLCRLLEEERKAIVTVIAEEQSLAI